MSNAAVAPSARAAVFTAVCVALALGAHLPMAAGGVPLPVVVLGAGAVFAVARVAAGRERGLAAIGLMVGACQFGLHLGFDASTSSTPSRGSTGSVGSMASASSMHSMGSMGSMASTHDPLAALSMAPMGPAAATAGPHAAAAPMGLSTGMALAHVLAALLAAWWLRRGEAATFACARWAGALVRATWQALAWLLAAPLADGATSRAAAPCGSGTPPGLRSRLIRFSVIRRGPPTVPAV
jgi:hypothetical protein